MDRGAWWATVYRIEESVTTERPGFHRWCVVKNLPASLGDVIHTSSTPGSGLINALWSLGILSSTEGLTQPRAGEQYTLQRRLLLSCCLVLSFEGHTPVCGFSAQKVFKNYRKGISKAPRKEVWEVYSSGWQGFKK